MMLYDYIPADECFARKSVGCCMHTKTSHLVRVVSGMAEPIGTKCMHARLCRCDPNVLRGVLKLNLCTTCFCLANSIAWPKP